MIFALQKWLKGEAYLQSLSCTQETLLADLAGKTVAIVGNARSLTSARHGPTIDACDVVIRINSAPMPSPASHGSKTTWLALATNKLPNNLLADRAPNRLLWMSKKRRRLNARFATHPGFYLHPQSDWTQLKNTLGAPPSTGIMLIDMVASSQAREIHLFGFDFFASRSLSGRRGAHQVPHKFDEERAMAEALLAADPRITLHPS